MRAQDGRCGRKHLDNRVVELANAGESCRKSNVTEIQARCLDEHSSCLRPLGTRDSEGSGAKLLVHCPRQVTFAHRKCSGETGYAFSIDEPVGDQPKRPSREVGPGIPLGRSGGRVGSTSFARSETQLLGSSGGSVKLYVAGFGQHGGRTAGPAVNPGRFDRSYEPPVETPISRQNSSVARVVVETGVECRGAGSEWMFHRRRA